MAEIIEITVTKDYVGEWGEYEGIREIIQNGIGGISRERWNRYKRSFLVLKKKNKSMITTYQGDLLTDPKHAGRIYVKGIEVEWHDDLVFGYNFRDADIDRDRKMISSWDLEYKMGTILGAVVQRGHKYKRKIYKMLKEGARDVKRLEYAGEGVAKMMLKEFTKEHGTESMPVASAAESREVGHYGKRGIVVPEGMAAVMKTTLGDMAQVKRTLCEATYKVIEECDLTENQRNNYRKALEMIRRVKEVNEDNIQLVVYKDTTLGQWVAGKIRIGTRALETLKEALCTLVHELCHGYGTDGEKGFVSQVEYMLAEIAIANMVQDDTFSVDKGA